MSRLGVSKGSASQGLKFLVGIGAITTVYVPRDRRTFYVAETKMRSLFSSALQNAVKPHLEGNARLLAQIEENLDQTGEQPDEKREHYRSRVASLVNWNEKAIQLLPLLDKLISLPTPAFPLNLLSGKTSGSSRKNASRASTAEP